MATTITHGGGAIVPALVDGFEAESETRTRVHRIIGRPDPDITLRPLDLRSGVLTLLFATGAAAASAESALRVPQVLTLSDPEVPQVAMSFVVAEGRMRTRLDPDSRSAWLLEVPFCEVGS
ncbi:hypothetical protein MRBLWO14_001164 [Microbacterium sp. LWO14-1.2]|uniref:hypothetical protein n=1 Tax=Microbacterium sp. LWO14-1.2 TaxID=3135263 RepID=UPI00313A448C